MNAKGAWGALEVVLTTGKMSGNRADYYEDVADGREDYYAESGAGPASSDEAQPSGEPAGSEDARGRWVGRGCEQLGLGGSLVRGELSRLVSDMHPKTGELLGARKRMVAAQRQGPNEKVVTVAPVSGWDLTLSAPKSVSVLYAVAEVAVRNLVRAAHDEAVGEALAFVERHAAFTRRGAGGVDVVRGDGFIAAAFRHVTSRAGDPQLHSHVVVSNLIHAAGRYTRLDARPLLTMLKTGGFVYQAALREKLTERLGLEWRPVVNGHADVAGIPDAVLTAFSQRSQEIQERMQQRGESSALAAQTAALSTRAAKDYAVSTPELRDRWRAVAAEHGLTAQEVGAVLHRAPPLAPSDEQLREIAAHQVGPHGLTAESSSFTFRDVVRTWAQAHPAGASPERLEQLAEWTISQPGVREIDRTAHAATYSTQELLGLEAALIDQATGRAGEQTAVAASEHVDAAISRRPSMTAEQATMVQAITTSGAGLELVRGYAGAGKTYALEAAREAWEASGLRVTGAAIAGKAAEGLQAGSGIQSSTVARLLDDLRRGRELPIVGVLVIDEAGMVGTRTLHELAVHAARAHTKLVLVGDDAQLPELEAGGSFAALAQRPGAAVSELVDVRRQHDPGDIELLSRIRHGHADQALEKLASTGRIIAGATGDETRELLVRDWLRDEQTQSGRGVIVVRSRSEERDLSARARAQLHLHGQLGEDLVSVADRTFAHGDRVICGRNRPSLGVTNGTTATVETYAHGQLRVRTDSGKLVELPDSYLAARRPDGRAFLEHAYAITTARAQGATWQRSYILADQGTYQQEAYTQLSRHTDQVRLYHVTANQLPDDPAPEELKHPEANEDPLAALGRAMSRSRAKSTATTIAEQAGALHLADPTALSDELAALEQQLLVPATHVRRAETIDKQLTRDTASLRRLVDRAEQGTPSRPQRDAITKLTQRIRDAQSDREQLGDLDALRQPLQRAEAIRGELHRRQAIQISTRVRAATVRAPTHLTTTLGTRPDHADQRAAWDRGAQIIESYRQRFAPNLTPDQPGLGPPPRNTDQRRAWHAFHHQLQPVLQQLDQPGSLERS